MKNNILSVILLFFTLAVFSQKKADEPTTYKDDLSFGWKENNDTLKLIARSKIFAPIQLYFYSRKNNSELNSFLLKPKDSVVLASIFSTKEDSLITNRFNDSIRVGYFFGHKSLIHPKLDYPYRLPFKKGRKYEVSQSFNGKNSHHSKKSKYAIDFQLNAGEKVYAARGGIVVKVIDWFTKQGGKELIHAANKIVILHDDGTMASYVHLDYKGSFVKEGQRINKGDKIGVSGLTGYTRGPHLHFVVRKENDIAIPVYFEGYMGKTLKTGKLYKVK
ncbi:M23 family metallopeptidase [Mesonia aquimarina]|uniref:M23 family metallopeptidase n=1 Tax=Mesonia aquimarina TaxID=1504967 RepID=UPI000EF59BA4|nr:M23 family metallopeptidase [Mesonia aquimarina]